MKEKIKIIILWKVNKHKSIMLYINPLKKTICIMINFGLVSKVIFYYLNSSLKNYCVLNKKTIIHYKLHMKIIFNTIIKYLLTSTFSLKTTSS